MIEPTPAKVAISQCLSNTVDVTARNQVTDVKGHLSSLRDDNWVLKIQKDS